MSLRVWVKVRNIDQVMHTQFELESVHYIFKDSRYKPCLGKDTQYDDHYGSNA